MEPRSFEISVGDEYYHKKSLERTASYAEDFAKWSLVRYKGDLLPV